MQMYFQFQWKSVFICFSIYSFKLDARVFVNFCCHPAFEPTIIKLMKLSKLFTIFQHTEQYFAVIPSPPNFCLHWYWILVFRINLCSAHAFMRHVIYLNCMPFIVWVSSYWLGCWHWITFDIEIHVHIQLIEWANEGKNENSILFYHTLNILNKNKRIYAIIFAKLMPQTLYHIVSMALICGNNRKSNISLRALWRVLT